MKLPAVPALALACRIPAAQRARLGWCVLIVVAAHALAFVLPAREAASSRARITKPDGGDAQMLPDPDAVYVPRALLTTAPKPRAPVVVDYPYFDGEANHYTGEFDLFIDDNGGVVRVVDATPELPGILGRAVREAFLAARFSPGEVDGRPVRSRTRIEVTFDSRRQPSS